MSLKRLVLFAAALAFLVLAMAPLASAHAYKTTEDGRYRITWGLLDEPAFTHQKNRLDLLVRDDATGEGVGGLTSENLTVTLLYAGEAYDLGDISAYRGPKGADAGAGNYTAAHPVFLTQPGIYTLRVRGSIDGTPVDVEIPAAHEYEPMSEIMFPREVALGGADTSTFEARIAALEQEVQALKAQAQTQSSTPAPVTAQPPTSDTPSAGLLVAALGAVAAAIALRRKA